MTRPRTVRVTPQMLRNIAELTQHARAFAAAGAARDLHAAATAAAAIVGTLRRIEEEPQ